MEHLLLSAASGALVGAISGFVLAMIDVLMKDLRDAKLRKRGIPLPKDRVFKGMLWVPMMLLGAGTSAAAAHLFGAPLLYSALSPLLFLVPPLVFLILAAIF